MDFRKISESSLVKLAQLRPVENFFSQFTRDYSLAASILTELGTTGEVGLLPELIVFALHSNRTVRTAAHRALTSLLSGVPSDRWPELDVWMREALTHWGRWDEAWSKLSANAVPALADGNSIGPLAVAAMHANGRVREAAIHVLATRVDGAELPILLVRLNDWVAPIRDLARRCVAARMRVEYAAHLLSHLSLVLRVERSQRGEHEWLLEAVARLLNGPESAGVLQAGLDSRDRTIRRACLRFAAVGNASGAAVALELALCDSDPMCRLWAAKQLRERADGASVSTLHAKLCHDPFMPVRREVLAALVKREPEAARDALRQALLDRHSSMRELARYHLRDHLDTAEFYRVALVGATGATLGAAIRGLGESGAASDAAVVERFVESPEIRIRRAAIAAIGHLAPKVHGGVLLRGLADASPSVSAEARLAVAAAVHEMAEPLAELVRSHALAHVRKNALRLVMRLSKWGQLPLILAACRDSIENVALPAQGAVGRWLARFNRSFETPTAAQLSAAHREFAKSRDLLPPRVAHELAALLSQPAFLKSLRLETE